VGGAGDQCPHQGIAITAAGAADALQVVGRLRWHRCQQHRGEIADVDAHLQGGGGRQQIGIAAVLPADELGLETFAIGPWQQARVFTGHDPVHLTLFVEALVER